MKLYYSPILVETIVNAPIPVRFNCPHPTWEEFTEEIALAHPNLEFQIDVRTKKQLKTQFENLEVQMKEFC